MDADNSWKLQRGEYRNYCGIIMILSDPGKVVARSYAELTSCSLRPTRGATFRTN